MKVDKNLLLVPEHPASVMVCEKMVNNGITMLLVNTFPNEENLVVSTGFVLGVTGRVGTPPSAFGLYVGVLDEPNSTMVPEVLEGWVASVDECFGIFFHEKVGDEWQLHENSLPFLQYIYDNHVKKQEDQDEEWIHKDPE